MFPELEPLFRERSGAPQDASIYLISVINPRQIMLEGAVPTGKRKNGRPKWDGAKPVFKCVVTDAEYDEAVGRMMAGKQKEPTP